MDIFTRVSVKNSIQSDKISLPSELWKTIIEYNYDEDSHSGFGSILPYRVVNKAFSQMVLESIKKVRISVIVNNNINNPISNLKRQKVNDVICDCKKLQSLHMSVSGFLAP
jgi:hypothetical protein